MGGRGEGVFVKGNQLYELFIRPEALDLGDGYGTIVGVGEGFERAHAASLVLFERTSKPRSKAELVGERGVVEGLVVESTSLYCLVHLDLEVVGY